MTGAFALIGVLIAMIMRANKEFGKIENKKIYYAHIALMIFAVLISSQSLNILLQLVFQYKATIQAIYVQYGHFSPILNTIVWIVSTVLNVVLLFTIINVAFRSEKARRVLVVIVPVVLLINTFKAINEVIVKSTPEIPVGLPIGIVIIIMLIFFLPLFLFYRNQNVKSIIFDSAVKSSSF